MSERMSNERVKEIIKDLNKHEVIMFENTNNEAESEYTNVELHQALDIAIESLDNTMTNREYMHLVGVQGVFDTKFDLDKPLEKDFIEFLYMLEKHKDEWVDVKDRLPSESGTYLVSLNGVWKKDYCKFWFFGKGKNGEMGWDEFEGYENIIAWKPLPQPYERKE